MMTNGNVGKLVLAGATLAALALTFGAVQIRIGREGNRELLRLGLEDMAKRVRATGEAHERMDALSSAAALAKARAFARIVAADPGMLKDRAKLEAVRVDLDVDELHVSNERGILIASIPASNEGYDMASQMQSAPFMPAITNRGFKLVQSPMPKGIDGKLVQYAGVARLDSPGIVQVGFDPERVEEARKLADVDLIVASTRIARGGFVKVDQDDGHRRSAALGTLYSDRVAGRAFVCMTISCAGRRITAGVPESDCCLGRDWVFVTLCVLDGLLLFLLIMSLMPSCGGALARHARALGVLLGWGGNETSKSATTEPRRKFGWRALSNPVYVMCMVAFALALVVAWVFESYTTVRRARELVCTSLEDMHDDIADSLNDTLFFIGNAICRNYRRPEAMTQDIVDNVMKRYNIDELNVVDGQGVVRAGAIADIGFNMASNPNSKKFNCLLNGVKTYVQPFRRAIENPSIMRKYAGVAFPDAKGYIQIGFDHARMKDDVDYRFADCAVGWHVGERGFFICADNETGEIVSSGAPEAKPGDTLAGIGFDVAAAPYGSRDCFDAVLYGKRCLCVTEDFLFHRLIAAVPYSEITGSRNLTIMLTAGILLVVLAGFAFFTTRLSELVSRLRGFIAAEKQRNEQDLATAKTIQDSSLPVVFPDEPRYKIFACMKTAKEVGGDFYDFYRLPSGQILFLVADVSGKGVPAAMFMMKAKTVIKACAFAFEDLAAAVVEANQRLAENNDADMFVTMWVGVFDPETGRVDYVNAGHNPPLVKRADGSVEWIRGRRSLPLAAMSGVQYHVQSIALSPGDSVLLYTDGVTEAANARQELFGEQRLEGALARAGELFVTEILDDLDAFEDGAEQADDITMLALDVKR